MDILLPPKILKLKFKIFGGNIPLHDVARTFLSYFEGAETGFHDITLMGQIRR